jgi:hypothetical protein
MKLHTVGFWGRILLPNLDSSFNGGNPRNGLSRKTRPTKNVTVLPTTHYPLLFLKITWFLFGMTILLKKKPKRPNIYPKLSLMRSLTRKALATIVKVGFTAPILGKKLPSTT